MAIRHLGPGRAVYQPVVFQGALPGARGIGCGVLALAARYPEPVPRDRYDLLLKLDLDPEDADLHRELHAMAIEALEDIALVEARRARLVEAGRPVEAARPTTPPYQLWAQWNNEIRFLSRRTLTPRMKSWIIQRFGIANYRRLAD